MKELDEILEEFDTDDADVVKAIIPFFFNDSWEEYMRSWSITGYKTSDPDFMFILADRIEYFISDTDFDLDIDDIYEEVEKKYGE